jgi:RNA-binding protein 23/39
LAGRPMKTGWATNQGSINGMALVTSQEFPPDAATRAQNAYHVLAQLTTGSQMVTAAGVTVAQPTAAAPMFHSTTAAAPSVASGGASRVATVAEARASLAAAASGGMGATTTGPMGGAAVGAAAAAYHHPPAMAMSYATAVAEPALDPTKIGNAEHPTQHVLVHNMFDKDQETEVGWEKDIRDEFEEECSKYGRIASVTVMHKEAGGKIYVSFDSLDGAKTCAVSLAGRWFDKRQLRVEYVSGDVIRQVTTQIEMQGVDGK